MYKILHGVHVPHFKNTANVEAIRLPVPAEVEIPMSMHIGAPARPIVTTGEHVKVGQLIGEATAAISAPIHASVSGTVKRIGELMSSNGRMVQTVVIESDGLQELADGLEPPKVDTLEDFVTAVRASGLVGLGGAGFPTGAKLTVKNIDQVDTIIINAAECEPYITSDTRTLIDRADDVMEGARLVKKFMQVNRLIFGIEDNKPTCIKNFRKYVQDEAGMEVKALSSLYPQGGEKVLIFHTTGRIVPEGKLPIDVGVIVLNCTTLANIAAYCRTGIPLVEKCITVDGSAVSKPRNVIVPIGMRLNDIFEACGGFSSEPRKVLYGGPMMGIAVPDLDQPVLKNTNAIVAMNEADSVPRKPTACIRCGTCVNNCPLRLMPMEMINAFETNNIQRLIDLKVNLCMECGCCSYGCPAHRPLVQTHKLAKAKVNAYRAAEKAKAEAKAEKEAKK